MYFYEIWWIVLAVILVIKIIVLLVICYKRKQRQQQILAQRAQAPVVVQSTWTNANYPRQQHPVVNPNYGMAPAAPSGFQTQETNPVSNPYSFAPYPTNFNNGQQSEVTQSAFTWDNPPNYNDAVTQKY